MFYRIVEVSTATASGHTYVLVDFWPSRAAFERDDALVLTNDFLMQLRPTGTRLIDEDNPALGSVPFDRDLPAEIRANIEAYWERAQARGDRGSKVDPRIQRDESDPHGVLARTDVKALRGVGVEQR